MTNETASLVLEVDSTQVEKGTKSLTNLAEQSARTEKAVKGIGTGKNLNNLGGSASKASKSAGELAKQTDKASKATDKLKKSSNEAAKAVEETGKASEKASKGLSSIAKYAGAAGAALAATLSVKALVNYGDAWSDMQSKLGAAIKDMDAAPDMMRKIVDIANASYSPLQQTVDIYTRNVSVLRDMGKSADEAATFTEALNVALVATATKGQQAASVQEALSRAMATGKLNTMGLETVLTHGARVAEALADHLGTTVSGLRDLASQGKITGRVIADSLTGALETLHSEVGEMPATIAGALGRLDNSIAEFVGRLDQSLGITGAMAGNIDSFTRGLRATGDVIVDLADLAAPALEKVRQAFSYVKEYADIALVALSGFAAPFVVGGIATLTAAIGVGLVNSIRAVTVAMMANPLGRLVGGISAALYALHKFRDEIEQAIGIDVIGVMKQAANFTIGSFVAAYEDIKFVWSNFGDILGGAVVGGVNLAVRGINSLVQKAIDGVNSLINAINEIPGVNIGTLGDSMLLEEIPNEYADRLAESIEKRNAAVEKALSTDYLGMLVKEEKASQKAADSTESLTIKTEDANKATGGASDAIKKQIQALKDQARTVGMTQDELVLYKLAAEGASKEQIKLAKAAIDERKARELTQALMKKHTDLSAQAVRSLRDEVDKNKELAQTYGMSASAIELMTAARLDDELAQLRQQGGNEVEIATLEHLIALRRENAGLLQNQELRDQDMAQWQAWQQDISRIFDDVGKSLTDAIFDGGFKGRDLLKNMFKTMTLRVAIQPVMNAMQGVVSQSLGRMFGFQNPQQQAQGAGSLNLGGLFSSGNFLGELGAGLAAGAGTAFNDAAASAFMSIGENGSAAFGAGMKAAGSGSFLGDVGNFLSNAGNFLSDAMPVIGSLFAASEDRWGTAIGTAASMLPIPGAQALPIVGGVIDAIFGGRTPTTRRSKSVSVHYDPTTNDPLVSYDRLGNTAATKAVQQLTMGAAETVKNLFEALDVDAIVDEVHALISISTAHNDKHGGYSHIGIIDNKTGEYLTFNPLPEGRELGDSSTQFGFGGWSSEDVLPRLAVDMQMSILEAYQHFSDQMPKAIASMLEGVDIRGLDADAVGALSQSIEATIYSAKALLASVDVLPFENLKNVTFDAAAAINALAGGFENLTALHAGYIDNYYSAEEKIAYQTDVLTKVFDELGVGMPVVAGSALEMKDAFRALVDAQDVSTEEGQRAYVGLLSLSGAFSQLADAVGATFDRIKQEADEFERQIWQLTGNTAALRAQQLEQVSPENRYLQQYVWDLQDWQAAQQQAQIDAQNKYQADLAAWNKLQQAAADAFAEVQRVAREEIAKHKEAAQKTNAVMTLIQRYVSAQQKLMQEQIDAAQKAVDKFKSVVDYIADQIQDLRGQTGLTKEFAQQGWQLIGNTIATGIIPDADKIGKAVASIRTDFEATDYASQFEKIADQLYLANQLERIQGESDTQLSVAEQQLQIAKDQLQAMQDTLESLQVQITELRAGNVQTLAQLLALAEVEGNTQVLEQLKDQALDAITYEAWAEAQIDAINSQLAVAQQQYDQLRGLNTKASSMIDAMNRMAVALQAAQTAKPQEPSDSTGTGTAPTIKAPPKAPDAFSGMAEYHEFLKEYREIVGSPAGSNILRGTRNTSWIAPVGDVGFIDYVEANKDLKAAFLKDVAAGDYINTAADKANWGRVHYQKYGQFENRRWAKGGYYPGGIGLVGEEGPEIINFNRAGHISTASETREMLRNIHRGGQGAEQTERLIAEIQRLRQDNRAQAQAIVTIQNQLARTLRKWDATGVPETREYVEVA